MSGGGGSFESRRLKASGESSGCCKKGNLLLFVLVGFIVFYVGVGIHMYLGPHLSAVSQDGQSNAIAMAASAPASPTSLEAQLRGGREGDPGALGSAENPSTGTVAADGIDDAVTAVVSCSTTQGDLTIDVRGNWAPIGSQQFLSLVEKGLFTDLPFFRVCPRYITQFGPKFEGNTVHVGSIEDDGSLWGIRDMNFGYVFFAGSGKDSRGNQMVVALCETEGCRQTGLGKADWEVPVGTIRRDGFSALRAIARSGKPYPRLEMPGQAAEAGGPDQGRMYRDRNYLAEEYPFMEYWKSCTIKQKNVHFSRPLMVDFGEKFEII